MHFNGCKMHRVAAAHLLNERLLDIRLKDSKVAEEDSTLSSLKSKNSRMNGKERHTIRSRAYP